MISLSFVKKELQTMDSGNIVVFTASGEEMELLNKKIPELRPGEILVQNLYTTICGSDLHTFCGLRKEKTPTVLGHEIVGKVVKISDTHSGRDYSGAQLRQGDVVTWSIFSANDQSDMAQRGMPQKADNVFKYGHALVTDDDCFHGGLAEYTILKPNTAVLKLPEEVPLPVAATINCAVATVAGALRLAGNLQNKNVLITGMGLLGVVCAAMCRVAGAAKIIAADIDEHRLQQAIPFGVDQTHLLQHHTIETNIDIVFDMSGAPTAMEAGIEALGVGGVAVWVGAVFKNRKIEIDAEQIIRRLITIRGLHNYNYDDFANAVAFISEHHRSFPFEQIVAKEFSLSEAEQAFQYALKYKPLRVGIRINHL